MNDIEQIKAIQEIKQLKARYFRAADTKDMALMATVLAVDCELDFAGACTDPVTGIDLLPDVTEGAIRSRDQAIENFGNGEGVVTVHHGHTCEIELQGPDKARAVWSMTDHLYFPPDAPVEMLTGHGHYHETYVRVGGAWLIKTLRLTRIRVETTMRR
jgi:hypothetical protein